MKLYRPIALLIAAFFFQACSAPTQSAEDYVNSGKLFFDNKEYDKAGVQFKNALQINNETAEAFYYLALIEEKNKNWQAVYANLNQTLKLDAKHLQARLKLAELKLLSGQLDEARQDLEIILTDIPDNVNALALKGAVLLKQGIKSEAKALAEQALALDSSQVDAVGLKVAIFMDDNDPKSALSFIEDSLIKKPEEVNFYLLRLQILTFLKDENALEQSYRNLVEMFPDNLDFQYGLAKFYAEVNKDNKAEAVLLDVIAKNPDSMQAKMTYIDYLRQKSFPNAIAKLREFISQQPENAEFSLLLARMLMNQQQFTEAKAPLNQLIAQKKDNKDSLTAKVLLASIELQEGNQSNANRLLNEVLAIEGRHYDALLLQAKIKLTNQKFDEAVSDLRNIFRDYPDKDEVLILLARTYIQLGLNELADEQFRKALDINPANFDAVLPVVNKMIASQNLTRAEDVIVRALQLQPNHQQGLQTLAQVRLLKKDWLGTQQVADLIATNSQGQGIAKLIGGRISQSQGQCDLAVNQYREALAINPTLIDALNGLASCYETLNQRPAMLSYLNEFINKNPEVSLAVILKSRLLVLDKRPKDALQLLTAANKNKPNEFLFYEAMAEIYNLENQKDLAVATLEKGLKANPDAPRLLLQLATTHEQAGDYDQALQYYETLISNNPNIDVAINNLVSLLLDHFETPENITRAVSLSERFKDSTQPFFTDSYAWALFKSGKLDESISLLKKIVTQAPEVPVFRYHLGAAYAAKGDKDAAREQLNEALKLGEKFSSFNEKQRVEQLLENL